LRAWSRRHLWRVSRERHNAIIVGAGSSGEQIGRVLLEDPSAEYHPVGFIDVAQERWGSRIHGVKVLGGIPELRLALSAKRVRVVFACLSDLPAATAREVSEICAAASVDCRMLPALSDLLNTDSFAVERASVPGPRLVGRSGGSKKKR